MRKTLLLAGFATSLLFLGCGKEEAKPQDQLTARFVLLNEKRQETTVFAAGDNVIFSFQLRNKSGQDVGLKNPIFNTEHFCEVYQREKNDNAGISLGVPYQGVFCTYQGANLLLANSTLTQEISWAEDKAIPTVGFFCGRSPQQLLPVGKYRTAFTTAIDIVQNNKVVGQVPAKTYAVDFEVR
ncbi:hypothetical protein [Hymenobacter crusticola]|uniref:Lipoprotein n=1 Tax=Hymenobacter crusticola TaxID=1770526 RepID=A0A243WKW8_9BACT|nr:hypothetical protein [Hymenobacter crusticola]OUJ76229.1 hypothetical protein BXP70_02910 [Hymenobacter crusticola]